MFTSVPLASGGYIYSQIVLTVIISTEVVAAVHVAVVVVTSFT